MGKFRSLVEAMEHRVWISPSGKLVDVGTYFHHAHHQWHSDSYETSYSEVEGDDAVGGNYWSRMVDRNWIHVTIDGMGADYTIGMKVSRDSCDRLWDWAKQIPNQRKSVHMYNEAKMRAGDYGLGTPDWKGTVADIVSGKMHEDLGF